jgi:hypothetical protein
MVVKEKADVAVCAHRSLSCAAAAFLLPSEARPGDGIV